MLSYAFLFWRKKQILEKDYLSFSYHKNSGWSAILIVLAFLIIAETIAFHIIIGKWNNIAACLFTVLSIYALLWLWGDYQAIRLLPIILCNDSLHIHIGLRWKAKIFINNIVDVKRISSELSDKDKSNYLKAAIIGEPDFLITLKEPIVAEGLYGLKKKVIKVGIAIDEPDLFEEKIKEYLSAMRDYHTA